jgi:hypothetical protein
MTYEKGIHRPMVMGIQGVLGLEKDGFFGKLTDAAVRGYQGDNNLKTDGQVGQKTLSVMYNDGMSLTYRIFELIAFTEMGAVRNAWGATSTVPGDGAGKNYGVLQVNFGYGSAQQMRDKYLPANTGKSFEELMGSPVGAKAQYQYFMDKIFSRATSFATKIGDSRPRTIAMLCDAITQGGGTYPSRKPRSYRDWVLEDDYLERVKEFYEKYPVKQAFIKSIINYSSPGRMFAELYPRSGVLRFLDDQLSRRRTIFNGYGRIHGSKYVLSELGISNGECND